jgi:hypothetical protein
MTSDSDDKYLANADSRVSMTAWLLLESIFCECEALCTCGWDEDN